MTQNNTGGRRRRPLQAKIPRELRDRDQWIVWRIEDRNGKPTKLPVNATTGQLADCTDSATWSSFNVAVEAYKGGGYAGVGYVFSADDPYFGVDLDDCIEDGGLHPAAKQIVEHLATYCEQSPSRKGVKSIGRGDKPGNRCRTSQTPWGGEIEIYDRDRYFAMTGRAATFVSREIQDAQAALDSIYDDYFGSPAEAREYGGEPRGRNSSDSPGLSDDEVVDLLLAEATDKGRRLWDGEADDYRSQSEADLALVSKLVFYCGGERQQIDRLLRSSGLYREKWDRPDYRDRTIDAALETVTERYGRRNDANEDVTIPEVVLPGGRVTVTQTARQLGQLLGETGEVFIRGGAVVRLRDRDGRHQMEPLRPAALPSDFEQVARLRRWDVRGGEPKLVPTICPESTARAILHAEPFQRALPAVRVLSPCPVLVEREGGELEQVVGYDQESGILAEGKKVPEIPLDEAVTLLEEVVVDFDFPTPSDRSRALAAMITPALVLGGLLRGRAPADLGEADLSQAGKGYRVRLLTAIYAEEPRAITQRKGGVGSVDESFGDALFKGYSFVFFDNIRGKVDSPAIEAALTEDSVSVRVPYSGSIEVDPRRMMLFLTSNSAELTRDLANRTASVRLQKRPAGYAYRAYAEGDVLEHVRAHQPRYLGAVFAVVRAWHEAGRPRTNETRHDFRVWAQTLDWIVQHLLGAAPLLDGHQEMQERVSTPALTWLRDVALVVRRAGRRGQWLRAHELMAMLVSDGAIEIPGLSDGDDPEDQAIRPKILRAIGSRMAAAFGSENQLSVDGEVIYREEVADAQRRSRRRYRFVGPKAIMPGPDDEEEGADGEHDEEDDELEGDDLDEDDEDEGE